VNMIMTCVVLVMKPIPTRGADHHCLCVSANIGFPHNTNALTKWPLCCAVVFCPGLS
jgi:hypothetical protein